MHIFNAGDTMKSIIICILVMLCAAGSAQAIIVAEDDFNRADNTDIGPKWYEEANNYEIQNNTLFFRNESSAAVINQNVSIGQGNYVIEFTYYDLNESVSIARLMIHFYAQSYTSRTESMVIQLREANNYALAYWGNGSYTGSTLSGIRLTNNTVYKFDITGDNVTIYQNNSMVGYLEAWSDKWSNGTVGFACDDAAGAIALDDFSVDGEGISPTIISSAPQGNIYPEVAGTHTFNVTINKTVGCVWYVNGSLAETDQESTEHAYTNDSLAGGWCNVTAYVADIFGSDAKTWIFEVGADSITFIVLQDTPTNQTTIAEWDVVRIGSNVTEWSYNQSVSVAGWTYSMRFENGTHIVNHTAAYTNETLLFNWSPLLPIGIYYIDAKTPDLTAPANQYYMYNNWSTDHTFAQIAAKESNDVIYSWYNHTSFLHESYYVGRAYNADKIVSMNCSVSCFFDAETIIQVTPRT